MKQINKQTVGDKIKEAREMRSLSQKTLADKVGVSHTTICCYEKGTNYPQIPTLIKIAAKVRVETEFFFQDLDLRAFKKSRIRKKEPLKKLAKDHGFEGRSENDKRRAFDLASDKKDKI